MKQYLFGLLVMGILLIQGGCLSNRAFFHNKILIYDTRSDSGQSARNTGFIDFYKDTINKIDYPFDLFEKEQKLSETPRVQDTAAQKYRSANIYPWSGAPFQFTRHKKSIYINYTFKDEPFHRKYFQVSKEDTVHATTFDFLCYANSSDTWIVTRYTGDTTIEIQGKRLKCWGFTEEYPHLYPLVQWGRTIYLEKKSLLPVQINTTYYIPDRKKPTLIHAESYFAKIDSVFKRPWNSLNKKWKYAKCWEWSNLN